MHFTHIVTLLLVVACGSEPKSPVDADPPLLTENTASPRPPTATASAVSAAPTVAEEAELAKIRLAVDAAKFAEAKPLADGLVAKNPKLAEAHFYLGVIAERTGDKKAAEEAYKKALALLSTLEPAVLDLSALYIELGRGDEALAILKPLVTPKASAEIWHNQALALGQKNAPEARAAFDEAVKRASGDPLLHLSYGQYLGHVHDNDAAKRELLLALRASKDEVGVLASVGFELKNIGAFAECIDVLGVALGKQPAAELLTYRALCKLGVKDKPGALSDLKAAVAREPNYAVAHFYLGGRLAEDGKLKESRTAYETYVRLAPQGELVAKAKERIEILKKK